MDQDDAPDTPADEGHDTRDDDGRFRPGVSGNPRGRPPGSRRVLGLARALAEAGVVTVVMADPRRPTPRPAGRRRGGHG